MKIKLLLIALFVTFPAFQTLEAAPLVGGDRDIHGCIASAGYTWSDTLGKCARSWEYYTLNIDPIPNTGIDTLETMIIRQQNHIKELFVRDAETMIRDFSGEAMSPDKYTLDISYELVNSGSVISIVMNVYSYLGGAHGIDTIYTWNYDTKAKRLIPIWKLVSPSRLKSEAKKFETSLQSYYTKEGYPLDSEWLHKGLDPKIIANYHNWSLSTDATGNPISMLIYFADYQIGPHVLGMPKAKIDFK